MLAVWQCRNSFDVRGSKNAVPLWLQPSSHPLGVAYQQTAVIARENVNRVRQIVEQVRKALGISSFAEANDFAATASPQRVR